MSKSKPVKLKVVKTEADLDPARVVGKELFRDLYSNIYIAGKKKSGKTILLFNILDKCANKSTKVLIFASTVDKDPTYKAIIKMLKRKGISVETFDHFIDEDNNDLLADLVSKLKEEAKEEARVEEPVPETSRKYVPLEEARMLFGDELPKAQIAKKEAEEAKRLEEEQAKEAEKKAKKLGKGKKKLAPEYILCFDDLGEDMRKKAVSQLLIKNRHFHLKTIILSQWLSYLTPRAIRQLDYAILFGGFPDDKLDDLHKKLDLSDSEEEFKAKYKAATEEKYSFLTIDIADMSYRKKFDSL